MRPQLVLALFGLAGLLALGELAARATGDWLCVDDPGVFYEADAALGWRQRPHLAGWAVSCKNRRIPATLVRTDARGFVNPGRPLEKPPGTARILLLGGNVAQGFGVPRGLSLAAMLEQHADARAGRPLEVVSGAMGSFGLDQDLVLLRAEGARAAPDLVLALVDATVDTTALSPELIRLASVRPPAKPYWDVSEEGALVPLETPAPVPPDPRPVREPGPLGASALYRLLVGVPASRGTPPELLPAEDDGGVFDVVGENRRRDRVLRLTLEGLRDAARELGARFALVLVPAPEELRFKEEGANHQVTMLARGLGIPVTNLTLSFRGLETMIGHSGYVPGTTRWNADGHFLGAHLVWQFLEQERLLPSGVVKVRTPGGGRVAPADRAALATWLGAQREGPILPVVLVCLAGVMLVWLAAPLPPVARDWATIAVGAGVLAALATPLAAGAALGFALVFWVANEIPLAVSRRAAVALIVAALAVGPLVWLATLPTEQSVPIRTFVGLACVTSVFRCVDYAARRRRGGRAPLRDLLVWLLYFPTLGPGPIVSVAALARARADAGAPGDGPALAAHLGTAARGLARVAWGTTKVLVALACLNLVTPDVVASSGDAVGRGRLWLWLGEISLAFWALFSGWSDVGIGCAAMLGVRLPENFRRPWAATDVADLWRRSLATMTRRLCALVVAPVARRAGSAAGVLAGAGMGALAYAWTALALYGIFGSRPGAWLGLGCWAALHALCVVVGRRFDVAGRLPAAIATQVVVALAWVPLVAFPTGTLGTILRIYARLVGIR